MIITISLIVGIGCRSAKNIASDIKSVRIGEQVWMSENLNVDKFRNGDPIPEAKTQEEWNKAGENKQPAWCYYENDSTNEAKYGKLYNWYAVHDPRGLAPRGWRIPNDRDWNALSQFLGGSDIAGDKMKCEAGWTNNGNGSNESGFSGQAGGSRVFRDAFRELGNRGYWWIYYGKRESIILVRSYYLDYRSKEFDYIGETSPGDGFSVRCLKEKK